MAAVTALALAASPGAAAGAARPGFNRMPVCQERQPDERRVIVRLDPCKRSGQRYETTLVVRARKSFSNRSNLSQQLTLHRFHPSNGWVRAATLVQKNGPRSAWTKRRGPNERVTRHALGPVTERPRRYTARMPRLRWGAYRGGVTVTDPRARQPVHRGLVYFTIR